MASFFHGGPVVTLRSCNSLIAPFRGSVSSK